MILWIILDYTRNSHETNKSQHNISQQKQAFSTETSKDKHKYMI